MTETANTDLAKKLKLLTPEIKKDEPYVFMGPDHAIECVALPELEKVRPLEKLRRFSGIIVRERLSPGYYEIHDGGASPGGVTLCKIEISCDDLLIPPGGRVEGILKEIIDFLGKREAFKAMGFAHKRGYLFYGMPGCGKSSTANLIAREFFGKGGIVLLGSSPGLIRSALQDLRKIDEGIPVLVLLEDIDAMMGSRAESDLLNVLDGAYSTSNTIFLATTNFPEELGERIHNRPSRFDRIIEFEMPDVSERTQFFRSKMPNLSDEDLDIWLAASKGKSLAHCKELVVSVEMFGYTIDEVCLRWKDSKHPPKMKGQRGVGFGL